MADIGPWQVWPGKGYDARPFWQLTRRNPAWALSQEFLLTATRRDVRRFYDKAKADAEAAKLNAAAGVTVVRDQTEAPADADGLRLEATAREIYDSWKDEPGWVPWVEGGNSTKQDVARQRARDVLAGDPGIGHE